MDACAELTARTEREAPIADACARGDYRSAIESCVRLYGPEISGYLCAIAGNADAAREIWSEVSEDLCRGLSGFRWDSSLRTWLYCVARRRLARYFSNERRRVWRRTSRWSQISALAQRDRSTTAPYLRSEVKERVRSLREHLSAAEQELLILHIDRHLPWIEVARIVSGGELTSERDLQRASAACRKRFERVKARLRRLADARGLLC